MATTLSRGRARVSDAQPQMAGGLNTVSADSALLPTQLRRTENVRLTEFGAIIKRRGLQRITSAVLHASGVQNGYCWRQDAGTSELLVVANGTLYTIPVGTLPMTATAESGTLSTTAVPSFAQFRAGTAADVVYIADGGALNKWDGTTLTTNIAGTPSVTNVCVHNQRLWGTGDSSAPQSIYYSAVNNGDTLGNGSSNGGVIIVRTFGDEVVQGVASINTSLLVFHRRGISRITGYGQDDIVAAPAAVTADVGTIAPESIVAYDNVAYFLSERGLYRANEASVQPVATPQSPDPLLPIIRQLTATDFANIRVELNRATRELAVSIPGAGVYVFHTILNAWSGPFTGGYTDSATTALFWGLDADGLPVLYRGDDAGWVALCDPDGVYRDNVGADGTGGDAIAMTVQMHRMYGGDQALAKSWRWGYVTASLRGSSQTTVAWRSADVYGTFTLPQSSDEEWGAGEWGSGVWGGEGEQSYRFPMSGTGYYTDIIITDSGDAEPGFSSVQIEAFALGRR